MWSFNYPHLFCSPKVGLKWALRFRHCGLIASVSDVQDESALGLVKFDGCQVHSCCLDREAVHSRTHSFKQMEGLHFIFPCFLTHLGKHCAVNCCCCWGKSHVGEKRVGEKRRSIIWCTEWKMPKGDTDKTLEQNIGRTHYFQAGLLPEWNRRKQEMKTALRLSNHRWFCRHGI